MLPSLHTDPRDIRSRQDGIDKMFAHRLYTLIYNCVAPMLNAKYVALRTTGPAWPPADQRIHCSYVLTDEELTYNDVNDPWAQEAVQGLNAMLLSLKVHPPRYPASFGTASDQHTCPPRCIVSAGRLDGNQLRPVLADICGSPDGDD